MDELFEEIIKAFNHCSDSNCIDCHKHSTCTMIFKSSSIQELVIDLALDCKEFNESEEDD